MSCRRRDRTNLIGCDVGEVTLRGCSRGCCPFPDEEKFENTHAILSTTTINPRPSNPRSEPAHARPDLYFPTCGAATYKPKFICIGPSCRRTFKPFYDPDRLEYDISRYGWRVRPNPGRKENQDLHTAIRRARRGHTVYPSDSSEDGHGENQRNTSGLEDLVRRFYVNRGMTVPSHLRRYLSDDGVMAEPGSLHCASTLASLSDEEMAVLRRYDPDLWWTDVLTTSYTTSPSVHRKRCPSCGEDGIRVGSKFRVPRRGDGKAWMEIEQMVKSDGAGELLSKFEFCATVEEWVEMEREAERRGRKLAVDELWKGVKKGRLMELGLIEDEEHERGSQG